MQVESAWVEASKKALVDNQTAAGSFVASPDFSQYRFCWLRDSSFVAYAADRVALGHLSAAYQEWATRAVLGVGHLMEDAIRAHRRGELLDDALPPARFTLEGDVVDDDWPNFQLDGYGLWLWSLHHHLASAGASPSASMLDAVRITASYLSELAVEPCFDVWEMHPTAVHTSTLAGVAAGLRAAGELLEEEPWLARSAELVGNLRKMAATTGRFVKSTESDQVDASALWLAHPLDLVPTGDPLLVTTVRAVEDALLLDGGVRRFPDDTYYGGGAWPVLTSTLASCRLRLGDRAQAEEHLQWIEGHFDGSRLGEQFGGESQNPAMHDRWVREWGPPARELVWSHAMHLLLAAELSSTEPLDSATAPSSTRPKVEENALGRRG